MDVKEVGRELGVRYVLEGSVRRSANLLRVAAQLIDATTGLHVWANRLDGELSEIFEFQDQITASVVASIAPKILEAEIARAKRKPAASLDAYECYARGIALLQNLFGPVTKEGVAEAQRLFGRAMELDPDYAPPYGAAIGCYSKRRGCGWVDDPAKDSAEVRRLLPIVLRVARNDALALSDTAMVVAYVLHDLHSAKKFMDQALDLNANLAVAWTYSGFINLWLGDAETAREHFRRALRQDPHPTVYTPGTRLGMAHACFFLGHYDDAVSWAESELRSDPNDHSGLRIGAASAACAGNSELAQRLSQHLQSIDPRFCISRLAEYLGPYQSEHLAAFAQGLRLAGLPE